jgi:predicted small secreted protein
MKPLIMKTLIMNTRLTPLALLIACIALSGCNTMNAMGQRFMDATSTANSVSPGDDEALLGYGYNCPSVEIVQELNTTNDFMDFTTPRADELVSRVSMSSPQLSCEYKNGTAIVDLRFKVDGTLGPRGRIKDTDTPILSYPFFVAVNKATLTSTTKIMAKEIFSASITYNKGEDAHTYYETMRQVIPAASHAEGTKYKIYLGFQLTPEQLAYNRANPAITAAAAGVELTPPEAPLNVLGKTVSDYVTQPEGLSKSFVDWLNARSYRKK